MIADVYAGRPVAYTTFLAYDEVAHHSGIERPDTLADPAPRRPRRSAASPRRPPTRRGPYELVVLSDHGQSQGATFLQRYGIDARGARAARRPADAVEAETRSHDEALGLLGAALTEAGRRRGGAGARRRAASTRGRGGRRRGRLARSRRRGRDGELAGDRRDGVGLPRPDLVPARCPAA